ncbi:MAG: DUF4105 domain-containing protein [Bacteroidales bacterium]|nr:DUF4105 domain-containing protein [Bacteroidales bacterium]
MRRLIHSLLLALLALVPWPVSSQVPQPGFSVVDSTVVASLLTCSPGQQTYELYGHSAIRISWNEVKDEAVVSCERVYNFGIFDFDQPHFVWHFTLGECDYIAAYTSLPSFLREYAARGSSVTEQVLALYPDEARHLLLSLDSVCRPENRSYRYHIFRHNCTTKARDYIEAAIRGRVIYPARHPRHTFRSILHQFTDGHEWAREGNDLLLGAEADTLLVERDEQFSPIYLMQYFDSAFVDRGRSVYTTLVLQRNELLPEDTSRQQLEADALPAFPLSPRALWWLLFVIGVVVAAVEVCHRRIFWPADLVLMTLQGLAGCLVLFMVLCSEHDTVASNWQVWVLNPFPLFFVWSVVRADRLGQRHIYHRFACLLLGSFLLFYPFIPQHFSQLALPLALLLLSRAIVHLIVYRLRP